jgi:hypothetical protein
VKSRPVRKVCENNNTLVHNRVAHGVAIEIRGYESKGVRPGGRVQGIASSSHGGSPWHIVGKPSRQPDRRYRMMSGLVCVETVCRCC